MLSLPLKHTHKHSAEVRHGDFYSRGTWSDIPSTSHPSGSILHPHMLIYSLVG